MSEKLEAILDNVKTYLGIILILLVVSDAIVMASMHDEYGAIISYNEIMNKFVITCIIATIVIAIVYLILCIVLRRQQGENYTSCWDIVETIWDLIFISVDASPLEIRSQIQYAQTLKLVEDTKQMKNTLLWKKSAKGIQIWNLIKSVFLFTLGSGILAVVIDEWKSGGDQKALATVLGGLFLIIIYFWGIVCAFGIKKRPGDMLSFMINNKIPYATLNDDFSGARNYGSQIYMGNQYLFVGVGRGMQVVAVEDVTTCNVYRMAGSKLLSYYILSVATDNDIIMKYGIIPFPFYKLKNSLDQMIFLKSDNKDEDEEQ